jgi:Beta-propeller repeat
MGKWVLGAGVVLSVAAVFSFGRISRFHNDQLKTARIGEGTSSKLEKPGSAPKVAIPNPESFLSISRQYAKVPLAFEPNVGQVNSEARFLVHGDGYTVFFTPREAVFALNTLSPSKTLNEKIPQLVRKKSSFLPDLARQAHNSNFLNQNLGFETLRMRLIGANTDGRIVPLDQVGGYSNYFIGSDPRQWRSNIPTYRALKVQEVYPGVDLLYHGNQRQLEYDFIIKPGNNPQAIQLEFQGTERLRVNSVGDLILHRKGHQFRFHKPVVYQLTTETSSEEQGNTREVSESAAGPQQAKNLIAGRYVITGQNRVGFSVPEYDRTKDLVIDPTLSYSTFLGGTAADVGNGITVDPSGNAYIVGQTCSTDFPTAAPLQSTSAGNCDAFVTKLNPNGSALVFSTFLGGTGGDLAGGVAIDSFQNVYVTGLTNSTNFPTTTGAFQTVYGGGNSDVFITKLNPAGSALLYSTYLGGTDAENGAGIAVDTNGNAIVTGQTCSINLPTLNPFQAVNNGNCDAFVSKLNASGSALVYSSYLGGLDIDAAYGIAVDSLGAAFVTGATISPNFPTKNSQEDEFDGPPDFPGDAFVSKVAADGTLVYSSYLGGSGQDAGYAIAVDTLGIAYIAGATNSSDLIPTFGAFQQQNAGKTDAFVTKLNTQGAVEIYNTLLGGSGDDLGLGIAVDINGSAYVTGSTNSPNFPTANPEQTVYGGGARDAFVTKLNPSGTALIFSTFLGGADDDAGNSIAVDTSRNIYVTGTTASVNFPTTPGVFQRVKAGNGDSFVAKFPDVTAPVPVFSPNSLTFPDQTVGSIGGTQTVTLTNVGDAPLSIIGIQATGDFAQTNMCGPSLAVSASCSITVSFLPTAVGIRTGSLSLTDNAASSPQSMKLTGNAVVLPPDFTFSAFPTSTAVPAGKSAIYTLSISSISGFSQPINLSCGGAPPKSSCSFSSNSVTPAATPTSVTLTVATAVRNLLPPSSRFKLPPFNRLRIVELLPVCLIVLFLLATLLGLRRRLTYVAFGLAAAFLVAVGCNSGNTSGDPAGTPAATYQITVTATSNATTHSIVLNLQVN